MTAIKLKIDYVQSLMKNKGLTQASLAEQSRVSKREIERILPGKVSPHLSTIKRIAKALTVNYQDMIEITDDSSASNQPSPYTKAEMKNLGKTLRIAIANALQEGNDIIREVSSVRDVSTSTQKITSISTSDDPTQPIDLGTSLIIRKILGIASSQPNNPLCEGFHIIEEEFGYIDQFTKKNHDSDLVVFIDGTDDTTRAMRGIGGTSLISVYKRGFGWLAVVISDFNRMNIYWRLAGESNTHGETIEYDYQNRVHGMIQQPSFGYSDPQGWPLNLGTPRKTELKHAALNIYTGKSNRLIKTVEIGKNLLQAADGCEILSEGGSRGILLVAEGLIDASIEFVKGFRPLDFIPGAFIAEGAGATVVDLDGVPICFNSDPDFEETIDELLTNFRNELFDKLRQKFIVASSPALAELIVSKLKI